MRIFRYALLIFLAAAIPAAAWADLYQWSGKDGVIHITDDMKKVPEQYRGKVKVYKSAPEEPGREAAPAPAPPAAAAPAQPGIELYADHTIEWWIQAFSSKRDEIRMLESNITAKRQYVEVFEGGRRFGQTFGPGEVETYGRYKKDLPEDEKRLVELKEDLDELTRRATIAGVPREVRE